MAPSILNPASLLLLFLLASCLCFPTTFHLCSDDSSSLMQGFVLAASYARLPDDSTARSHHGSVDHLRPTGERRGSDEESDEESEAGHHGTASRQRRRFVLDDGFISVIETEAGEMRVLPSRPPSVGHGDGGDGDDDEGESSSFLAGDGLALGLLSLEPKALFLPHYTDADCLFVIYRGRGLFSWVDEGELREMEMKEGDSYVIERGTVFHFYNIDEGQRLHVFSIHDTALANSRSPSQTSQQQETALFHRFFVTGGKDPKSVLSGFDKGVLATAFNVSRSDIDEVLRSQKDGPIVLSVDLDQRRCYCENSSSHGSGEEGHGDNGQHSPGNALSNAYRYIRQLSVFENDEKKYEPYNILEKAADFSNDFGATAAAGENDFDLLGTVDKGIFMVKLKAGAVLAPHWNSRALEVAVVTKGSGEIRVVYDEEEGNGNVVAASEEVSEGSVFYVPRRYPMCQFASRGAPLEFIGFTTSSHPNRPQFLAGAKSVLQSLKPEVLASAFDIPEERITKFLGSQREAVILPGQPLEPEGTPYEEEKEGRRHG